MSKVFFIGFPEMNDFVVHLDPNRVFMIVDRDREWKKVTSESFLSSTAVIFYLI